MGAFATVLALSILLALSGSFPVFWPSQLGNQTIYGNLSTIPNNLYGLGSQPGYMYPTYQFSSWGGGGWGIGPGVTDAQMQQQQAYASIIFPWLTRGDWCANANASGHTISSADPLYNDPVSTMIVRYQTPFMIQEPLDGYGSECVPWSQQVLTKYPDLLTYDYNGIPLTQARMNAITKDYIRVDSINFSKQIYSDLVNIYNNMKSNNSSLINFWYGIEIGPGTYADYGDLVKPGAVLNLGSGFTSDYYWSNKTVLNFATSPQCNDANWCGVNGWLYQNITQNKWNTQTIAQKVVGDWNLNRAYGLWLDYELLLGVAYAAYNLTVNYGINHPFLIHASYDYNQYGSSVQALLQPANYPYPYNSSYVKGLNLFTNFIMNGVLSMENGNPPTQITVNYDMTHCRADVNKPNSLNGFLPTGTLPNIPNMMYLQAYCSGSSLMEPGNLPYNTPSSPIMQLIIPYAQILNRMFYVGPGYLPSPNLVKNDPSTKVTVLGSSATPLLLWFFTNSSVGDTASVTLNLPAYGFNANGWVAISVLDWRLIASGTGSTASFSVPIPAKSWNPVYLIPQVSDLQVVYSNLPIASSQISQSSATYRFNAPHMLSSWLVIQSSQQPSMVIASNTGPINSYASLTALNSTYVGMKWNGYSWQNLTQTGWYYDQTNHLLYIHYVADNRVTIQVSQTSSQQPSLILNSSQNYLTLRQGDSTNIQLNVFSYHSAPQSVNLYAQQLSSGFKINFSPSSAYTNFTSLMSVNVSPSVPAGTYSIQVQASSSTLLATFTFTLYVLSSNMTIGGGSGDSSGSGREAGNSGNSTSGSENLKYYTLVVNSGPSGLGYTIPKAGTYTIQAGTQVTVKAEPAPGWGISSWYVNGQYAGNGTSITFVMDADITVLALFSMAQSASPTSTISFTSNGINGSYIAIDGTKYLLPISFSWVNGSTHNISVPESIVIGREERYSFVHWSAGVVSDQATLNITVAGSTILEAYYRTEYLVNLTFTDSSGNPILPESVQLSEGEQTLILQGNYSFWSPVGESYTLLAAVWKNTGVGVTERNNRTFTVDAPLNITISLQIYPVVFRVTDIFGQPLQGAIVNITLPGGTTATEVTNTTGFAVFPQVPLGWYEARVSYLGQSLFVSNDKIGADAKSITLALSYPLVDLLGVFAGSMLIFTLFVRLKGRGLFRLRHATD